MKSRFRYNIKKQSKIMSEINVTPFVDVMLVLLIIFMITAPLMKTGIEIELPEVNTPMVTSSAKLAPVKNCLAILSYFNILLSYLIDKDSNSITRWSISCSKSNCYSTT